MFVSKNISSFVTDFKLSVVLFIDMESFIIIVSQICLRLT